MQAQKLYEEWLQDPLIDEKTKKELQSLAHDDKEIADRFFKWIGFGTGGLRGIVGAGSNRMNTYTVQLVTQAMANSLLAKGKQEGGVAIAHDSRHMSREFTQIAAGVLIANGIKVFIFPSLAPTPLLSYAVRYYQASAGIVITASHNPAEYNGYKAYNDKGNQMLTEEALEISSEMERLGLAHVKFEPNPQNSPLWHTIGDDVIQSYYDQLLNIAPPSEYNRNLRVLFTPLHGTGGNFVPEILKQAGFTQVQTVPEQMIPDGDFPTVPFPNPEDPKAFELAFAMAENTPYDLIIATDPDADRMGVAVFHGDEWVLLNGNQLGVLFADFLLAKLEQNKSYQPVVIKTIVTTEMIQSIAEKYEAELINTLTGFKYIGAQIDALAAENKKFIFGLEESYGYLAGTAIRDKDAVLASLLISQIAAFYHERGLTLVDRLDALFKEHGYYLQDLVSYSFANSLEYQRAQALIQELETTPIEKIGSEKVVQVLNYGSSERINLQTGEKTEIHLPKEGVLQWITERESKITLRPSGTEPKMKLYLEVVASTRENAEEKLDELRTAFDALVSSGLQD